MEMGIFATQYTVWGPTLLIMRSKYSLLALCKGGVLSNFVHVHIILISTNVQWSHRCQAWKDYLDKDAIDRSQAFNEMLFEVTSLDIMWEEYGVIGDLVVSYYESNILFTTNSP